MPYFFSLSVKTIVNAIVSPITNAINIMFIIGNAVKISSTCHTTDPTVFAIMQFVTASILRFAIYFLGILMFLLQ